MAAGCAGTSSEAVKGGSMSKHYNKKIHDIYDKFVAIRLSNKQYDRINEYCSLYNLSFSEFFRKLIDSFFIKLDSLEDDSL